MGIQQFGRGSKPATAVLRVGSREVGGLCSLYPNPACPYTQAGFESETDAHFLLEVVRADENRTILFIDLVLYELSRRLLYSRSMLSYGLLGLLF